LQVIGTWDDHDYGLNDAGKEFSGKVVTQRLMLDFLDEPEDSKRYALRNNGGILNFFMFILLCSYCSLTSFAFRLSTGIFFNKASTYNLLYILVCPSTTSISSLQNHPSRKK
jgi:hypothetical protein